MTRVLKMSKSLSKFKVGDLINADRIYQVMFTSDKHLVMKSMDMQLYAK